MGVGGDGTLAKGFLRVGPESDVADESLQWEVLTWGCSKPVGCKGAQTNKGTGVTLKVQDLIMHAFRSVCVCVCV